MAQTYHRVTQAAPRSIDPVGGVRSFISRDGLTIVGDFEPVIHNANLDSLAALFAGELGERLDKPGLSSWRQRRRITVQEDGRSRVFFVKRFEDPPAYAGRVVRRTGTGARTLAGLEWAWMHRLHEDDIPCVCPVLLGEELRGVKEIRSVLVTEAVPGQSLERWMSRWHELGQGKARDVLLGVARLVSKLHRKGYMHRDLYLSHIFYDSSSQGDESLRLIDLQRVIRPRWCRGRWIVKDLASLNFSTPLEFFSRADRLRWLLVYLGTGKLDGAARRLVYQVVGKTMRITRREERRKTTPSAI